MLEAPSKLFDEFEKETLLEKIDLLFFVRFIWMVAMGRYKLDCQECH